MRDSALDNFKFILISLVVVGHAIEPLIRQFDWIESIYVFIYLFHMPMFAYISGVVSSQTLDSSAFRNIISKLIIPYIVLEILYSIFDYYVFSRANLKITPLVPYWILWYLFSLILWRMLLPIFAQFKFPITLSLIAGLACGLNKYDYNLSFSRTFVFFPFFLIGHYYHLRIFNKIKAIKISPVIGLLILAISLGAVFFLGEVFNFNVAWLYGSRSYSALGVEWEMGVLYRFYVYVIAFLLGLACLSLVTKGRNFSTKYGANTLYIYILHGFVMKGLIAAQLYLFIDTWWEALILMPVSLLLLPILSGRYVRWAVNNIINPFGLFDWLFVNQKM